MPKEFACRLDQERLWQSVERLSLGGAAILTPAPEDWQGRRLPGPLFHLHYLLRPIRLAAKHLPRRRVRG